jgi:hypothetical protein
MGLTYEQIQTLQKEQQKKWSEQLPDDAFADDVEEEPTYARVNRRATDVPSGGSSLD